MLERASIVIFCCRYLVSHTLGDCISFSLLQLGISSPGVKLVVSKEKTHLFMSVFLQMVYRPHHTPGQDTSVNLGFCAMTIPALIQFSFDRTIIGRVNDSEFPRFLIKVAATCPLILSREQLWSTSACFPLLVGCFF